MSEDSKEAAGILTLLDRIEGWAKRPDRSPKSKLIKCGKAAHAIRVLLFTGARKAMEAEQGIDWTPENEKASGNRPHLVRYDDEN